VIVSGSSVSVAEAAREGRLRGLDAAIIDCIKRWAVAYPHELVVLKGEVQELKEHQVRGKGWGRDKHLLHKGRVPVRLHQMMRREIDKKWLDIPELRNRFFDLFKVGCINHSDLSNR
jgi:hypothetical protein